MKKIILLSFLLLLMVSCNNKYIPLSNSEVSNFINKEKITLLDHIIYKDFNVILFDTDVIQGHYIVYKDNNNKNI
jgi:hypothetical protein